MALSVGWAHIFCAKRALDERAQNVHGGHGVPKRGHERSWLSPLKRRDSFSTAKRKVHAPLALANDRLVFAHKLLSAGLAQDYKYRVLGKCVAAQ